MVYLTVILIIIIILFEKSTTPDNYAVAIGGNRLAAELSGINAVRTMTIIYVAVKATAPMPA